MAGLSDKYSVFETDNNPIIAATLLYGFLDKSVSDEKKMDIMKKLSVIGTINSGAKEDVQILYGDRFNEIAKKAEEDSLNLRENTQKVPGEKLWTQPSFTSHFDEPGMEEAFQMFDDGMHELLDLLEEKEPKIDKSVPNAGNQYNLLKGFLKDSYEGTYAAKMEDPNYAMAEGLTAKIGFKSGGYKVNYNTNEAEMSLSGQDTNDVLMGTKDLGLLESMAGGMRLNEKTQECIRNGNVSRQELTAEVNAQVQRLDKVMHMDAQEVKDLNEDKILQNDMEELTNGARGISYAVSAAKAKQDILNAGYPVEDMVPMSTFYVQIQQFEKRIKAGQKSLAAMKTEDPKREVLQQDIDQIKENKERMEQIWKDVTDVAKGPLTEERRQENLGKLKEGVKPLSALRDQGALSPIYSFEENIDKRVNAQLSSGDKALLANDYTAMYNALQETDPRTLFTSSKQFREMKQSVKELAEMEQRLTPDERKYNLTFTNKKKEVMEKTQNYLRYKNRQMNGPKRGNHKRSELETKRVQAADSIYSRLLSDVQRENPGIKLNDYEKAVVPETKNGQLLEQNSAPKTVSFDNYIKLHTGLGAMSGTHEEMVDDMAKVMAAMVLPKQKPPMGFDKKEVHNAAEQIKDKFNLRNLQEDELRNALNDPQSVRKLASDQHKKTYCVDREEYEKYVSDMRKLYTNMEAPDGKDKEYQKIFNAVKKAAHLPKDPEKIGAFQEKLDNLVEQTNSEIFEAMDRYVDRNAKQIGPENDKMLQVLSTMEDNLPGAKERTKDMVERIRTAKGITDISDPNYIELEEYGLDKHATYGLQKSEQPNQLSKDYHKELCESVRENMNDTRKELAGVKEEAKEKNTRTKAKEAPIRSKKKKFVAMPRESKSL